MSPQEYANAKAAAEAQPRIVKSGFSSGASGPKLAEIVNSFAGLDQTSARDYGFSFAPPDTHGAVGRGQFVEVVNNRYAVYSTNGTLLSSVPMSYFFSSTSATTDARVVYDRTYDRFIVINIVEGDAPRPQFLYLAISASGDATGAYIHYAAYSPPPGYYLDFPQLGMDRSSLFLTFDVISSLDNSFQYAEFGALSKYNAYFTGGFGLYTFANLSGTIAPSIVMDGNAVSTLLVAPTPPSSSVRLYKVISNGGINPSISAPLDIPTRTAYNMPRSAKQPGTTLTLDALDGRFQNAGVQVGGFLYQIHTTNQNGSPTPRFLKIDILNDDEADEAFIGASGSSDDFNPSISANDTGDVFIVWSSTDADAGLNAGIFTSYRPAATGFFLQSSLVFRSGSPYSDFRWGDYSSCSLDPMDATGKTFWAINETVESTNVWGSFILSYRLP